jgi:hypothetical protein
MLAISSAALYGADCDLFLCDLCPVDLHYSLLEMSMPGSKPEPIVLTPATRLVLEQLERWTFGQPISFRARIILAAADGCNNTQIARDLGIVECP